MFREILTSRAIVIGVVFFVLVAVSSLLYNWHVRSEIAAELERSDQVMQQLENKKEKHTTQDAGVSIGTDRVGETERSLETDDPQTMSEETKALPRGEVSDYLEMAEVFLPDETTGEAPAEDVGISPYGFGPYPELPEGWSFSIWPRSSPEHELMMRVQIKLAAQGIRTLGATMNNGLIYPTIKDTVYVEWDDEAGQKYISNLSGDPEACERLSTIEEAREKEGGFTEADIPLDIKIVPFEDGGIDPYHFLELPRR